ncbi:unnamed protein product [Caenorhabditis angaria]|uniref:MADF domain-containing protein n=1 Tax=Caenorhabditis angaria TaxID=860376 RepID=A0A9P1ICG9_9PELO|nr:unnamed protein product [Caenorhabditis angaria]
MYPYFAAKMHGFQIGGRMNDDMIEPTFNLRLIEAVKHSRCLFDSTDRQYRNTEYKNKVWNRLVTVLCYEGDPRMLASRWKQLRDKYGKEKRKQKYSHEKSAWQYFKHLSFLDPHMTDRTDVSPSRKEPHDVHLAVTDPMFAPRLIEQVHQHPCLYDVRDAKYRHADWRHQAWTSIIETLQYPSGIPSIYKQWKKFRDRYVREKRRLKHQADLGIVEVSTWEYYDQLMWMDPFLDDRAAGARSLKRGGNGGNGGGHDDLSEYGDYDDDMHFMMMEKRGAGAGSGDVLLDGDSAFSASIVSDLRTLPEHARAHAKQQIEILLESGTKMGYM